MMIHVMRDGQQFGPYTLEDLNAYLAQGSLLATDQAWWEGTPNWVPMNQVPGVQLPGMTQPQPVAAEVATDPTAGASPEVAVVEGSVVSAAISAGAKKKKILIIAGSSIGVAALAGVILFVWPGLLKDGGGEPSTSQASSQTGDNEGGGAFAEVVEPIFKKSNCYDCHDGADPENKKNKAFNLAQNDSIKEDIQVGNANESELILRLTDNEDPMPPKGEMLSSEDVQKIKDWINAGAKF